MLIRIRLPLSGVAVLCGLVLAVAEPVQAQIASPNSAVIAIANLNADGSIYVTGNYTCDAATSGKLANAVDVEIKQAATTLGEGVTDRSNPLTCDGRPRYFDLTVTKNAADMPDFVGGSALADATLGFHPPKDPDPVAYTPLDDEDQVLSRPWQQRITINDR